MLEAFLFLWVEDEDHWEQLHKFQDRREPSEARGKKSRRQTPAGPTGDRRAFERTCAFLTDTTTTTTMPSEETKVCGDVDKNCGAADEA